MCDALRCTSVTTRCHVEQTVSPGLTPWHPPAPPLPPARELLPPHPFGEPSYPPAPFAPEGEYATVGWCRLT